MRCARCSSAARRRCHGEVAARRERHARGARARARGGAACPWSASARADLDRLSDGGAIRACSSKSRRAAEFSIGDFEALVVQRGRALRLLVLDGVEDPRNLGACLRTADAAGIDAVVVPKDHSAPLTPAAHQGGDRRRRDRARAARAESRAHACAGSRRPASGSSGADARRAAVALRGEARAARLRMVLGGEGRGCGASPADPATSSSRIPMVGRGREPERLRRRGHRAVRAAAPGPAALGAARESRAVERPRPSG